MAKKVLTEVCMGGNGCSTYLGSVEGVLKAAGLWDGEFYKLAGMTGMAFHFIVHEKACPSSVTVYDWQQVHFAMMDRIGVQSEVFNYFYDPKFNTFESLQARAITRIKESIDRGIGVVVWTPTPCLEFGIITGYDDEDGVFTVKECTFSEDVEPLLYNNLGKSEVPLLSYQIFYGKQEVPVMKIYWESLLFAVNEWKKEFHINPHYASGKKGYHNLINTLSKGDFDEFGLAYIIYSYTRSKECIARYLDFLTKEETIFSGLKKAAELYQQITQKYREMEQLCPFCGERPIITTEMIAELKQLVEVSLKLESSAMECIERQIQEQAGDYIVNFK